MSVVFRRVFLVPFVTLCSLYAQAQDTLTYYYSKSWRRTNEQDSIYYTRKAWETSPGIWSIADYYPGGKIQMTGQATHPVEGERLGPYVYYREDGSRESAGAYLEDKKAGVWRSWFKDGALTDSAYYKEGKIAGPRIVFRPDGSLYAREMYDENGVSSTWFYPNGNKAAAEEWRGDKLVSSIYWDEEGHSSRKKQHPDRKASFPGGDAALYDFIRRNVAYPAEAIDAGIQGKVYVRFVVGTDGTLEAVRVEKPVNHLLDKEAIRVVRAMPKWEPAYQNNMPVRIYFSLPISFVLK